MYYLSELHGRLGQILKEKGDMPVCRLKVKGIDTISTDIEKAFVDYDNECISLFMAPGGNILIINPKF